MQQSQGKGGIQFLWQKDDRAARISQAARAHCCNFPTAQEPRCKGSPCKQQMMCAAVGRLLMHNATSQTDQMPRSLQLDKQSWAEEQLTQQASVSLSRVSTPTPGILEMLGPLDTQMLMWRPRLVSLQVALCHLGPQVGPQERSPSAISRA